MSSKNDLDYTPDKGIWLSVLVPAIGSEDILAPAHKDLVFVPGTKEHGALIQEIKTGSDQIWDWKHWDIKRWVPNSKQNMLCIPRTALPTVTWDDPAQSEDNDGPELTIVVSGSRHERIRANAAPQHIAELRAQAYKQLAIAEALEKAPREAQIYARIEELTNQHFRVSYAKLLDEVACEEDRIAEDREIPAITAAGALSLIEQLVLLEFPKNNDKGSQ